MSNLDEKVIELIKRLYWMTEEEIIEFKSILRGFTEQEKKDLALTLWQKLQEEESIFKKLFRKLKTIWNDIEEAKTIQEADLMLLDL